MKMCTTDITVTADGNMEVISTYPKYGWRGAGGAQRSAGGCWGALGVLSSTLPPPCGPSDGPMLLPRGDQCEKRNSLYIRTEQPGRFSYTSPREPLGPRLNPAAMWPLEVGGLGSALG